MRIRRPSPITASARAPPPIRNSTAPASRPRATASKPDIVAAAAQPMTCGRGASEFRAYLPRARWIRDANDSYFAAMTYPQGYSAAIQPSDIHDATWGVLSAVYGGAIHPTAEGHAAMADAALPAAASVLRLGAEADVTQEPLAPVAPAPAASASLGDGPTELGTRGMTPRRLDADRRRSARRGGRRRCWRLLHRRQRAASSACRRSAAWQLPRPRPAPAGISPPRLDRASPSSRPAAGTRSRPCRAARCPR